MTREEFKKVLELKKIIYKEKRGKIIIPWNEKNKDLQLPKIKSIPEGVEFSNQGYVDLESVAALPKGTIFRNTGNVYLNSLISFPEEIEFSNGGNVWLNSHEFFTIPEWIIFSNHGSVYLNFLNPKWFNHWKGNIKGINSNILLNKMIKDGLFNRKIK